MLTETLYGLFGWFLAWRPKPAFDREKTTAKFKEFEKYRKQENKLNESSESYQTILCAYILLYRKSPFEGDDNLSEAQVVLGENGIYVNVMRP